jgi:hypothetical protein
LETSSASTAVCELICQATRYPIAPSTVTPISSARSGGSEFGPGISLRNCRTSGSSTAVRNKAMITAKITMPTLAETRTSTYTPAATSSNRQLQDAATRTGQVTASAELRRVSESTGVIGCGTG